MAYNAVSAKGYTLGYIGSVILLITILFLGNKPEWLVCGTVRLLIVWDFCLVGLWWGIFTQYTLRYLPKDKRTNFTESI
ncbi:MAG: MFS transporter [Saprospiraceae bacterium]|nr:MFS transporter [Saprospiraceae bacterium]